jgi:Protein of unknown function (DUF2795)
MKVDPIEVRKHLGGVDYPARRGQLAETAKRTVMQRPGS